MSKPQLGKIITFYSYKGGVGRSMALANLAAIAACNGLRVLIMDWEMEAPGLHQYFRGVMPSATRNALRQGRHPGVLNSIHEWIQLVQAPERRPRWGAYEGARSAFDEMALPIMEEGLLPAGGCLDFVGAGSKLIDDKAYQEVLSDLDWHAWIEQAQGGHWLAALRDWARNKYDYVLIDSRTGYADVAGVCTMQLPDEVCLCFGLNRQNLQGIAQVASAIHQNRHDDVRLHAVPMRLRKNEGDAQVDALLRATRALKSLGGGSQTISAQTLKQWAVYESDTIDVVEMLSWVSAQFSSDLDPTTANYTQLARLLFNSTELTSPKVSTERLDQIRESLRPQWVTLEYLMDLRHKPPELAHHHLQRLLQAGKELAEDGAWPEIAEVNALVDLLMHLSQQTDVPLDTMAQTMDFIELLEFMLKQDPQGWAEFCLACAFKLLDAGVQILWRRALIKKTYLLAQKALNHLSIAQYPIDALKIQIGLLDHAQSPSAKASANKNLGRSIEMVKDHVPKDAVSLQYFLTAMLRFVVINIELHGDSALDREEAQRYVRELIQFKNKRVIPPLRRAGHLFLWLYFKLLGQNDQTQRAKELLELLLDWRPDPLMSLHLKEGGEFLALHGDGELLVRFTRLLLNRVVIPYWSEAMVIPLRKTNRRPIHVIATELGVLAKLLHRFNQLKIDVTKPLDSELRSLTLLWSKLLVDKVNWSENFLVSKDRDQPDLVDILDSLGDELAALGYHQE